MSIIMLLCKSIIYLSLIGGQCAIAAADEQKQYRQLSTEHVLPNQEACLTAGQCLEQSQLLAIIGVVNFHVGAYETYGCFYNGDTAYFGFGGSDEDMASQEGLSDGNERIWCTKENDTNDTNEDIPENDVFVPSKPPPTTATNPRPSFRPVTTISPSKQPTVKPVSTSPSKTPTLKPITDSPSKQPTPRPATDSPSKHPTLKPITDSPSKQPTPRPATVSPSKQITVKPVTDSPSKQPTIKPVTDSPSKQPTPKPVTDSPSKQPTDASAEDDNNEELNWLNEHNNRRQEHHENYGVSYEPLSWSSGLQDLAQTKANYHASQCSLTDNNKSSYGKNSLMKLGGASLKPLTADATLKMWFDDTRVQNGYPDNGAMTQALWRSSDYVGCATAEGNGCAVAICYYARPGNCGMDASTRGVDGDWETKAYADTSACTPFCPPDGCIDTTLIDNRADDTPNSTRPTSSSPSTSSPSNKPTPNPVTKQPSPKPVTTSPTKQPTFKPVTDSPSKKPTLKPVTNSPSKQPTVKPVTNSPSKKPTIKPVIDSPSKQPTPKPTTKSPETPPPTTKAPTPPPTRPVCQDKTICDSMRQKLGYDNYYVGQFVTKGCFSEGDAAYFGIGGELEDMFIDPLPGNKERLWCDFDAVPDTMPETKEGLKPTPNPTRKPTNQPTESTYCIDMIVKTDRFGEETGFHLVDKSTNEKLANFPAGSLQNEKTYTKQVCVPKGKYEFTVEDSFFGVCCVYGKGFFKVNLDGEEIILGGNMANVKSVSYTILPGHDFGAGTEATDWLEAHNKRREAFHTERGKDYRPLLWSTDLEKDASNWASQLVQTCIRKLEPGIEEGENVHVHPYMNGLGHRETPDYTLSRWVDKPLDLNKGYPENQTATQALWRSSRYVGCSTKTVKNADGSYCYASVCRYLRPGNCAMNTFGSNWVQPTISDESKCGKSCPPIGCY